MKSLIKVSPRGPITRSYSRIFFISFLENKENQDYMVPTSLLVVHIYIYIYTFRINVVQKSFLKVLSVVLDYFILVRKVVPFWDGPDLPYILNNVTYQLLL